MTAVQSAFLVILSHIVPWCVILCSCHKRFVMILKLQPKTTMRVFIKNQCVCMITSYYVILRHITSYSAWNLYICRCLVWYGNWFCMLTNHVSRYEVDNFQYQPEMSLEMINVGLILENNLFRSSGNLLVWFVPCNLIANCIFRTSNAQTSKVQLFFIKILANITFLGTRLIISNINLIWAWKWSTSGWYWKVTYLGHRVIFWFGSFHVTWSRTAIFRTSI